MHCWKRTIMNVLRLHRRVLCTNAPTSEVTNEIPKSRMRRMVDYVKNIIDDYKTVAVETVQDMKEKPVKATFYISLITGAAVLAKTNPSETEFHSRLTENTTDLMLVGEPIRNPHTVSYLSYISHESSESRLRCFNFGLFSLMCSRECGPEVCLYEMNCKYVKPHWTEFYKSIVDVGIFGKWVNLENAMKDYDIQTEEWLPDGEPNEQYRGYIERNKHLISWDMKVK